MEHTRRVVPAGRCASHEALHGRPPPAPHTHGRLPATGRAVFAWQRAPDAAAGRVVAVSGWLGATGHAPAGATPPCLAPVAAGSRCGLPALAPVVAGPRCGLSGHACVRPAVGNAGRAPAQLQAVAGRSSGCAAPWRLLAAGSESLPSAYSPQEAGQGG